MNRISGAALVATLSLGLALPLAPPGSPPAAQASPAAAPAVPTISWGPCRQGEGLPEGVQCARVPVPLDYDEPAGATLTLDLLKAPATDPANRIGTLFVNPGGPGGSSRWFAAYFDEFMPAALSARFDVVGIDPRGVGPSAPALCRSDVTRPPYPRAAFPRSAKQVRARVAFDRWERRACRTGGAPVVAHMSTADTARDMDLVRQAVGDPRLSYYGVSYGTQLGSTYAALFPDRVRAMVLDGVLDPVAWSTGRSGTADQPFSERIGSGHGAWLAMVNALAECERVGRPRCALGGRATEVWRDLLHRLRQHPYRGITYADVVSGSLGALYDAGSIRDLMRAIRQLHSSVVSGRALRSADRWRARSTVPVPDRGRLPGPYAAMATTGATGGLASASPAAQAAYGKIVDPFAGVACADSDNPRDPLAWVDAAARAERDAPWFGPAWSWASSACAGWPARTRADRFTGPYATTTSAPVLVVGNTFDPATPLPGARAVNRLLEGSRLLVLDGWGHGALATGPCIDRAYSRYLVDDVLPAAGTVCRPARPLFPRRG